MSFLEVTQGPLGQVNNNLQANLANNAAQNASQMAQVNSNNSYVGGANQAAINAMYGPQGFGGQTAQYAKLGAAYNAASGYTGDTGPSVFDTGAAPYNDYGNPALGAGQPNYFSGSTPIATLSSGPANDPASMAYFSAYPDVAKSGMSAYDHYTQFGQNEGRQGFGLQNLGGDIAKPMDWNSYFSSAPTTGGGSWEAAYLLANPDVAAAAEKAGGDINAFADAHYKNYGEAEGRSWFDPVKYLQDNPDVAAAGVDPFLHYEDYGRNEGRADPTTTMPGGSFDPWAYLQQNPDVAKAGVDPLQHYLDYGQHEGRDPNMDWNSYFAKTSPVAPGGHGWESAYLAANPDVAAAAAKSGGDVNTFADQHYTNYGQHEGRSIFDPVAYLQQNPDVAAAGVDPFQHYTEYGKNEGRFEPTTTAFDPQAYLQQNPDVAKAGVDPLQHYFQYGEKEDRSPNAEWNSYYTQLASNDSSSPFKSSGYASPDPTRSGGGLSPIGSIGNSPYDPPPGADISNPTSYWYPSQGEPNAYEVSRAPYATQLANDPAKMYDMAVRLSLELSDPQDSQGRQGIAEAMLNRYAAVTKVPSGANIDPLSPSYFPTDDDYLAKYANATQNLKNNPQLLGQIYGEIGQAAAGSNLSNGATDWASGSVANNSAKVSTETWKSPIEGERFFRKDISNSITGPGVAKQVQDWYNGIQNWQPQ